jgi:chaperonin GroES
MPKEVNKVKHLDSKTLDKIGTDVVEYYKADLESRSEWATMNAKYLKLFAAVRGPKSKQFLDEASNVCLPIMSTACLQFQARAYDSIIPGKEIMRAWSTDGRSVDSAERVGKHMNWQLLEEIPKFEKGMDKLTLKLPIFGSAYKKTFYDPVTGKINSKLLGVDRLVLPYGCEELEDCERKTHIIELTPSQVMSRIKVGTFLNYEKLFLQGKKSDPQKVAPGSPLSTSALNPIKEAVDEIDGLEQSYKLEDKPRIFLEQHALLDLDNDGIGEPYVITVDEETGSVVRIVSSTYTDPLTRKKETWEYFTDYGFIPNPESHYSYGFGLLLYHINESCSTIINELIDAGNLNNMQAGFRNRRSGIKDGELTFKRGELKPIDAKGDDLRKNIFMFDFKPPSPALFSLLSLLHEFAKDLSSQSDAVLGQLPSSDTTATAFMSALEQGLKVFSVIHKRMHASFRSELKKIFMLNRLWLKEKVYFQVQDSTSTHMVGYTTGKADYVNSIDIIPVSDPTIISKAEKAAKAQMTYQLVTTDPLLINNQQVRLSAITRLLEANDIQNIQQYLPKPEDLEPVDYPPVEENARFLQELDSSVLPQQDHVSHIEVHTIFQESQFGGSLTPQGRKLIEAHGRAHMAQLYLASQRQGGIALGAT